MTVPDYQSLMAPVLRKLDDGHEHPVKELTTEIAADLGLTDDELTVVLPSGRMTVWRSRVHWATQYLYQAGAIARSKRGVFTITERGRSLLREHPERVGNEQLEQFEEYRDFKSRSRQPSGSAASDAGQGLTPDAFEGTPYDRIAVAAAEANSAVAAELLARINTQPPEFLEKIVLELLVAMGYAGALGAAEHLGRSGDEGVDGVIRQDALGLDQIFVQAKRYASGRTVGRPEIQEFVGALHGAQATRGVFITTSRFSREAVDFADRVQQRIVLIDGHELTRLMVDHGVGTQAEQTIVLKRVDEDFFE